METYRLSSRLKESNREYVIQTFNDSQQNAVLTTVVVDGTPADEMVSPHPSNILPEEVLSLVKMTHAEKRQELELILQAYQKSIELDDVSMMHQLGTVCLYKGLYKESTEILARVTTLQPDHHQSHHALGQAYLSLGFFGEALTSASRAVELRPGFADYRNALGDVFTASHNWAKGIKEYKEGIRINLYYADAYLNLGVAILRQAIHESPNGKDTAPATRAADCVHKAGLILADLRGRLFEEGLQQLEQGRWQDALDSLTKLQKQRRDHHRQQSASYYMKFILHPEWISEEALSDRITYLQAELKKNPQYVDLMADLGTCYCEQARILWQKGVEQYRRAAQTNPSLTWLQHSLTIAQSAGQHLHVDLRTQERNPGKS